MTKDQIGKRAVVLGGSMGGVLAARVLSEFYGEVLVVDRDKVVGVSEPRRGTPHTIHAHALHARGHLILEDLFPGLTDGLIADGIPTCDLGEMHWYINARRLRAAWTGLRSVMAPRPMLEEKLRARVAALPNVTFLERYDILGIVATPDNQRIVGVRVQAHEGDEQERLLEADLIVDSTGKGSRTPVWLNELGYTRPEEETVKIGLAYTTRHYKPYPGMLEGIPSINQIAGPSHPRGAFFGKIGPDLVNLSLTGILGDYPPTDPDAFLDFVRSLPVPQIYETLREAEPINDPVSFRFPASVRRHYERLPRFPEGYLVMGDAVCSFNPVYGQGMSVAAMEVVALRDGLRLGSPPDAADFFTEVSRIIDTPWEISVTGDLAFPGVPGERPLKVRVGNAYMARLQYAATKDAKVTEGFMRVAGLLDPPEALMRPQMVGRVLRRSVRRPVPGKPVPSGVSSDAGARPTA
ncbi:FAD-dependent oxidoreductase [Micromonospora sp. NBC_01796]|uniref:FAD-dependent oxidoreductase n=1 Tax=Micromonospora sp. NBC_01796 TaxID=2975987 RepID=UPI002DDA4D08|nr:FAD-dependent monooxygenase [Micromonospora sp. NBC_01796]WSA87486.1 FAD-binding monooxygenase [Micromonospora sp. NBC_01796]